ncbi:hypothetical protein F5141DRAFT_1214940 [Pisolithus sp. B1]|nr:hypothetical protein F5141DRAFT_1214940 [Pisolithus sp. B1]
MSTTCSAVTGGIDSYCCSSNRKPRYKRESSYTTSIQAVSNELSHTNIAGKLPIAKSTGPLAASTYRGPQCPGEGVAASFGAVDSIPETMLRHNVIARDLRKPTFDFQEYTSVSPEEFEAVSQAIKNDPNMLKKPKLTYFVGTRILTIQCPSAVHEAPLEDVAVVFLPLLSAGYDHDIMRLSMPPNFPMKENNITCTPDLVLSVTSMDGPKRQILPFILECAFTQSRQQVFKKIALEVAAHPEVEMVVIVVIEEVPVYHAPRVGAILPCQLTNAPILDLEAFISACNPRTRPDKLRLAPIVTDDHTWCRITRVHYYVWLQNDTAATPEEMSIQIDPEAEVEQTEYTAHGIFPENIHMDPVKQLWNKGLERIKESVIKFYRECGESVNEEVDCGALEVLTLALPQSWDNFCRALVNGMELTAFQRYQAWLETVRGTKRSLEVGNGALPGDRARPRARVG